jgi:uncharacterized OB-fold protein
MAFLSEIEKKFTQVGNTVVQKTKDTTETIKLNGQISEEEKNIDAAMLQIGKLYYETYGALPADKIAEAPVDGGLFIPLVSAINAALLRKSRFEEQLRQLKGIVQCPVCGTYVSSNAAFCGTCGRPMPMKQAPAPAYSAPAFNNSVPCAQCGTVNSPSATFCIQCGAAIAGAPGPAAPDPEESTGESPQAYCGACGAAIEADAAFCVECGRPVENAEN